MSRTATLRPRRVRTGAAALAALACAGVTLAGAPAAFAQPGDSGDLKIHNAGVPHWDTRDDLKGVCKFSLSAFNFESLELLEWTITPQPPSASGPTLNDTIALIAGRGHTEEYALPDGDYLLTWEVPGNTEPKQKVFTVDCDKYGNKQGAKGPEGKPQDNGTDWSEDSPHGAVPAGGGGMAGGGGGSGAEKGSSTGLTTAVVTGAAGVAGLVLVRRARRRAHGAA
ncbi:hypothetical protein [Streptomyces xantholiticus]|uniref:hypothetical protein n=1 Tax=Streptomyces xantholiticus TaxID=68285 RepID=UPI001673D164|nr:hypothetical protein [Streptomyces xantholiticus]GGW35597.1 hypothetical protein GCM10010381_20510 [Streptomyces xantholiticus]